MSPAIDKLVAANLIVRKGHGNFDVADPLIRHVWLQRLQMRQTLASPTAVPPLTPRSTSSEP